MIISLKMDPFLFFTEHKTTMLGSFYKERLLSKDKTFDVDLLVQSVKYDILLYWTKIALEANRRKIFKLSSVEKNIANQFNNDGGLVNIDNDTFVLLNQISHRFMFDEQNYKDKLLSKQKIEIMKNINPAMWSIESKAFYYFYGIHLSTNYGTTFCRKYWFHRLYTYLDNDEQLVMTTQFILKIHHNEVNDTSYTMDIFESHLEKESEKTNVDKSTPGSPTSKRNRQRRKNKRNKNNDGIESVEKDVNVEKNFQTWTRVVKQG